MTRKDLVPSAPEFKFHPFPNSSMGDPSNPSLSKSLFQGRGLLTVQVNMTGSPLTLANTHLESPIPRNKFQGVRATQLQMCMHHLDTSTSQNVILCGDMNWLAEDGEMSLFPGHSKNAPVLISKAFQKVGKTVGKRFDPMRKGSRTIRERTICYEDFLMRLRVWTGFCILVENLKPFRSNWLGRNRSKIS